MLADGASDEDVAAFIESHLRIVLVTREEADHLDRVLGLRTRMPAGWTVGDDVMARFAAGGIRVIPKPRQ
jgi:hypothetical protein